MEFDEDENCRYLDKQYMLGDSLLVAPVFNEDGIAHYYLPKGRWTHYLTGEVDEGGHWRREKVDYLTIPLWVRENTILPVAQGLKRAGNSYRDLLTFKAYEITKPVETEVWEHQQLICKAHVDRENGQITVEKI